MKTQSLEKVNSEKALSTISRPEWFYFFPPKIQNRDLSSKQTIDCVERVFAHYRYIALDFCHRYIYMYVYIVDKANSNIEISPRKYKK